MSRPLVCDNPACETMVNVNQLELLEVDGEKQTGHATPIGWVIVSEIDAEYDDVMLGECCSRTCAAALLTMETAD